MTSNVKVKSNKMRSSLQSIQSVEICVEKTVPIRWPIVRMQKCTIAMRIGLTENTSEMRLVLVGVTHYVNVSILFCRFQNLQRATSVQFVGIELYV